MTITAHLENPYPIGNAGYKRLRFRDDKHIPSNKRPYEANSKADLSFTRCDIATWLAVELEEVTTDKNGQDRVRMISMTLDEMQVLTIRAFIAPPLNVVALEMTQRKERSHMGERTVQQFTVKVNGFACQLFTSSDPMPELNATIYANKLAAALGVKVTRVEL